MQPVITPSEMAAIDAEAPESVEILIDRAGRSVARAALQVLGGAYGKRCAVFVGKGNNGKDGRVAAEHLRVAGVRCEVLVAGERPRHRPDLVIDGLVGTGLNKPFVAPVIDGVRVLAIDIPSGIHGLTGQVMGTAMRADLTVTFAALKPGLLMGAGPEHAGRVEVADIGLDVGAARTHLLTDTDVAGWPARSATDHKWNRAVWVIGGQPGMTGALGLASEAAARAGAGYVAVSTPGSLADGHREAVSIELPAQDWGPIANARSGRFGAMVIGPGLDTSSDGADLAAAVSTGVPCVLDAGAIDIVARQPSMVGGLPVVLTPHDGEFARLTGAKPGGDRIEATRRAAVALDAVVLLKGPTTVVASPAGDVRLITSGDARLATAGTGDVLSGVIAAGLAAGLDPLDAAAVGAHLHGRAGTRTGQQYPLASDLLPVLAPEWGT